MLKKVLLAALVLVLVGGVGLFFWARAVFTGENVRAQLAAQLSEKLGQPVRVGAISASVYPRVTVDLGEVTIGEPARITLRELTFGTDLRALLSRRIEHATVLVDGARVELPLPPLFPDAVLIAEPVSSGPSVSLVSVDEVLLRDVQVVSGGRTLNAEIEAVPQGFGVALRKVELRADEVAVRASGAITSLAGPVGRIDLQAEQLDLDRLLGFLGEFSSGVSSATSSPASAAKDPAAPAPDLTIALTTSRAIAGGLQLDGMSGTARVTGAGVSLDPVGFGLFGGRYDGTLSLDTGGAAPVFRGTARVKEVDMAAVTQFAGNPGTLSGRLSGDFDLSGSGLELGSAMQGLRGRARLDLTNGTVPRLDLVRTVITATSGRSGSGPVSTGTNRGGGERFDRVGATLAIASGVARTQDLRFQSSDLLMDAAGSIALSGSAVDLAGRVQLSDALTQQAGRDLVRYTAEEGRVTLTATITGSVEQLRVRVDVADLAKRAIRNRAEEEVDKAIERGIGSIFKRRPPG